MIRVYLPYIRLHGLPIVATLRQVKEAGFDGIEYHLIGSSHRAVMETERRARELDLAFHLHQGWSLAESPKHWFIYALHLMGCLPRARYALKEHIPLEILGLGFPGSGQTPVVVYADRMPEVLQIRRWHGNFWIQTCCPLGPDKKHRLDFLAFLMAMRIGGFRIVFDTQHVLEFATPCKGVSELPNEPQKLLGQLEALWGVLKNNVEEIHLANFNPELGNTRGRNVPLEAGVLPLRDFCQMVKESGWEGTVVPEVTGVFWSQKRLRTLREQVQGFFE